MTKTISRLCDQYSDATAAMRDLESLGIAHSDISIVPTALMGSMLVIPKGSTIMAI